MKRDLKTVLHYICLALILALPLTAGAFDLEKKVVEYKLANGMRWLLVVRRNAPVFSGVVMIRVGGTDETPGKTGLAHMFEHMAFKGSSRLGTKDFAKEKPILDEIEKTGFELTAEGQKAVPDKKRVASLEERLKILQEEAAGYQIKNQVWEVMVANGASDLNAYTSKDATAYHASMPVERLDLFLDVISQMVNDPVYREFYTERSVILEERRGGVDNDPDGKMSELLVETAFQNGSYHSPVIGSASDVAGLTIADAREFHDRYYVASNMVGALVGDIDIEKAKRLIDKYFGPIPAGIVTKERLVLNSGGGTKNFAFDAEPAVVLAYHKPTLPDHTEFVFDVIDVLMCDGPTSRLEKRLVYDEKVARDVSCSNSYPGSRLNNLMLFWMEPNRPHTPEKLTFEVEEELERIKREPISDEELGRVQTKVAAGILYSLEKNLGLAMSLAEFETIFGDWRLLARYPSLVEGVTKEDVMRTANEYFSDKNATKIIRLRGQKKK